MSPTPVLTRSQIDSNALDVTDRLQEAGYQALLVGGCVRDLLVGLKPKDFDVATNATPEQVRELFRRSRMVGRRFRIVHVRVGREIIEVSTFRRSAGQDPAEDGESDGDRMQDASGILLRDNVFGTLEEDAFRRDFTINALYFDPSNNEVIDYAGGLDDLQAKRLCLIGEPDQRLREDPVRLLRAIRFQAKLGFSLEPSFEEAIPDVVGLLQEMPPARLFDEVSKMFLSGYGEAAWGWLRKHGLRQELFPCTPDDDPLIEQSMQNTDKRIAQGKGVTPGFLFAVLLWRDFHARQQELLQEHKPHEAGLIAADAAFYTQAQITTVPRRISQFAKDAWLLQDRLIARRPRTINRLMSQQRFRAAYDLLVLRADSGESELFPAAAWWTEYQERDHAGQQSMRETLAPAPGRKRKRRRRKPKKNLEAQTDAP